MRAKRNLTWHRRQHPEIPPDDPLCSKCGLTNDRPPQRYCSGCHAVYMREYRRKVAHETKVLRAAAAPEAGERAA